MYQKIRKKKSVQCFPDFFIAVVGHEIFFLMNGFYWTKIFINVQCTEAITEATVSAQGAGEEGPSGAAGAAGKASGPLALRPNATVLFLNRKVFYSYYGFII